MPMEDVTAVLEALEPVPVAVAPKAELKRFCFASGTIVSTLRGDVPVERLRFGDQMRSKRGSVHGIVELAEFDIADLPEEDRLRIGIAKVRRGALEGNLPRRDLLVSDGQEFVLAQRLEMAHAVRMASKKSGDALRGLRFVVFGCHGLSELRVEGLWTTRTPMARCFPETVEADG